MSLDGKWNIEIKTPMGLQKGVVELKEEGGKLTGTQSGDQGSSAIDGTVEGGRGKWDASITSPMPMTLSFDVGADGDTLEGNVKAGAFGSFPVTGTRA